MANPTAFARATRIGSRVVSLAEHINAPNQWEIEVAGMLSHIGTVVLPPGINERLQSGQELTMGQQEYVAELPAIAVSVLADIPRLDSVRRIIAFQRQRYDGRGPVAPDVGGEDIPLGARIVRVATDYDTLEARGTTANRALRAMRNTDGQYDPRLLDALEAVLSVDSEREMAYVKLADLQPGMVPAADLRTSDNTLLVSRGQELSARTDHAHQDLVRSHLDCRTRRGLRPGGVLIMTFVEDTPAGDGVARPAAGRVVRLRRRQRLYPELRAQRGRGWSGWSPGCAAAMPHRSHHDVAWL